jgi:hypothetical protein
MILTDRERKAWRICRLVLLLAQERAYFAEQMAEHWILKAKHKGRGR